MLKLDDFKGKLAQISLQDNLEYLVDESGQLTIDDVSHKSDILWIRGKKPIVGFSHAALWVRFQLVHDGDAAAELFLEDKWAPIFHLELFHFHEGVLLRRKLDGQAVPFAEKDLDHRLPIFKLQVPRGSSTFYAHYKSDNILGSRLVLWDPEAFYKDRDRERLYIRILLGFFIILPLYNAFFYITL
ncbi:MAG TPA: 7TM-DISM domain-containing protein [Oligoflexus sp.]|uniref:7TMR-DISMED2 domain-containing protein n=1 Tax=Oligoflexus sp. TaxID=1971216 RepID=UPI002D71FD81|nr:7TM-DISM domain-containing protein [Oligoflexus sp.]HYX31762.1 7TM-DISM domain-containing protein [Oligoflexus sp.]